MRDEDEKAQGVFDLNDFSIEYFGKEDFHDC